MGFLKGIITFKIVRIKYAYISHLIYATFQIVNNFKLIKKI